MNNNSVKLGTTKDLSVSIKIRNKMILTAIINHKHAKLLGDYKKYRNELNKTTTATQNKNCNNEFSTMEDTWLFINKIISRKGGENIHI